MTFDNSFLKNDSNRKNDNNHFCFLHVYILDGAKGRKSLRASSSLVVRGGKIKRKFVNLGAPLRKNSNKGKKWKEKEKEANRFSPGSRYGWVIKNTGVSVHLNFLTSCHCYQSRWSVSLC